MRAVSSQTLAAAGELGGMIASSAVHPLHGSDAVASYIEFTPFSHNCFGNLIIAGWAWGGGAGNA